MDDSDVNKFRQIFQTAQHSKTSHKKLIGSLTDFYNKNDLDIFVNEFIKCLSVCLRQNEKDSPVQNVLEFTANFCMSIQQQKVNKTSEEEEDQMCPLLNKIFRWLLRYHSVQDMSLRFGICTFINTLLDAMGANAFIDDKLSDKITTNMMERLQDRSPKVRAQAILALSRLQEPQNPDCVVIQLFIDHLMKDPHPEVRKVILSRMAKTKVTLKVVLKKVRDVHEDVRKQAYIFISKVTVKSLSINQREYLLESGLNDPSEKVKQVVKNVLLPVWLRYYENNYIKLLEGLDAENSMTMAATCLETLLKNANINDVMEQLPITPRKVIPIEQLTNQNVLLWRYFVKRLKEERLQEYLEEMLPELSEFCNYVREFMAQMGNTDLESWEAESQKLILLQLFEMEELFDLSDEAGRVNLRQLITEVLVSKRVHVDDIWQDVLINLVKSMERIIPSVDERLTALTLVISELRMPTEQRTQPDQITEDESDEMRLKKSQMRVKLNTLTEEQYQAIQEKNFSRAEELKELIEQVEQELKEINKMEKNLQPETNKSQEENVEVEKNDFDTLWKCLTIMSTMLQAKSVKNLTGTIHTLVENIAYPNIVHENPVVCALALKTIGIACLLDGELAKKYFVTFVLYTSVDQKEEIFKISLMSILDMLVCYGLQHFNVENTVDMSNQKKKGSIQLFDLDKDEMDLAVSEIQKETENIVTKLIRLLDHENEEYQLISSQGLCKLLLTGRIISSNLLSRLIIILFNPVNEKNAPLRKNLVHFFNCYVNIVPDSRNILEECFFSTLKTLENAPSSSPLLQVDQLKVVEMILGFTSYNAVPDNEDYSIHNNLALKILSEINSEEPEADLTVLVKSLKFLNIQMDDGQMDLFCKKLDKAEEIIMEEDKQLLKTFRRIRERFVTGEDKEVEEKDEE